MLKVKLNRSVAEISHVFLTFFIKKPVSTNGQAYSTRLCINDLRVTL